MLRVLIGNLLDSKAQTLVNTVNCVGVMGKGIALEFKQRFPDMYHDYVERCERHEVKLGRPYPYHLNDGRIVLNFPTKDHWRSPSRLSDIVAGLQYLVSHYRAWRIESLAVPPLGCGNGQLEWDVVGPTLYKMLSKLKIDVEFYAPRGTPNEQLTLEFLNQPAHSALPAAAPAPRVPAAWIALVEILRRVGQTPTRQPTGRIIFQKIAYFATEFGIPTGFSFRRGLFGPYDPSVKRAIGKLMNNGLIDEKALGQMIAVRVGPTFDDARKAYAAELKGYGPIVERVVDLLARTSTHDAEIAATIHYVWKELSGQLDSAPLEAEVIREVLNWKGDRVQPSELRILTRALGVLGVIDIKGDPSFEHEDDLVAVAVAPKPEHARPLTQGEQVFDRGLAHSPGNRASGPSYLGEVAPMKDDEFFIEKRPEGDFAIRKPNSDRASAVEPTQADAIERARQMNPEATIHVERVRHTNAGSPDKWRKL
jgi:uncharacterized protein YwgA/O-acetyl-ADP-ribose deacetylase (regulator of RNase III)